MSVATWDEFRVQRRGEEGDDDGFEERGDRVIADAIEYRKQQSLSVTANSTLRRDQYEKSSAGDARRQARVSQIQRPDPTLPLYTKILLMAGISQAS